MSVPQQSAPEEQLPPASMQLPSLQMPLELQVKVPQHWEEDEQFTPFWKQEPSVQTPELQVKVPQHWADCEQRTPLPTQLPSLQTPLRSQVKAPQQSPEELQFPHLPTQETMVLPGTEGTFTVSFPLKSQAKGKKSRGIKRKRVADLSITKYNAD